MLIFTEEDFVEYRMGNGNNPRTEIVVRHASGNATLSHLSSARGACLDDPHIAVPLRTGLHGSRPCVCVPRAVERWYGPVHATNCDGSG